MVRTSGIKVIKDTAGRGGGSEHLLARGVVCSVQRVRYRASAQAVACPRPPKRVSDSAVCSREGRSGLAETRGREWSRGDTSPSAAPKRQRRPAGERGGGATGSRHSDKPTEGNKRYHEVAEHTTVSREEVKEEPEEWVRPESPGSPRLPVTVFCSPETQQEDGTQDAGEVNREFRMRASEEMPEAEVPETVTKRGGNRYNLRPRITTPRNLQDYDCE
ncbi:hypothetical protein NDU88_006928 [Pleurodeles waltl]|uniref:Uncharacterized protein n=1 Tax=Pleurodeles waltl TaxID=8319 RepID=A0AAV7VN91_PLEWA|nr:hypothetical protein NDU88_006928 [Pleurodeles waltl]